MADVKALIVRLEADLQNLKAGMTQATGEISKFTGQTNALGTSTMRNWRMANQMGDSFRGAALSMAGLRGQGVMVIGILDNIQDYFERTKLRGLSFKDALKNLSGEMSMMVTGGIIFGLIQAFNLLQKSIEEVNKILSEADKHWDNVTIKLYEQKLKDLKREFDKGRISADEYRVAAANLNKAIIEAKYRDEINKTTKAIDELTKAQQRNAILSVALSSTQAGNLLTGLLGTDVDAKISAFRNKLASLQADLKMDLKATTTETNNTISDADAKTLKEKRALTKAEYELYRKYMDKKVADEQARNRENRLAEIGQINELNKIKRDDAQKIADYQIAQTQRIYGYYQSEAGSMAGFLVSVLNGEKDAWKQWADSVIKEIERVIAKELILAAIKGAFGLGPGGFVGGIWKDLGSIFGSPAAGGPVNVVIHNLPPGAFAEVITGSMQTARPGTQARLSQVVARGQIADMKR